MSSLNPIADQVQKSSARSIFNIVPEPQSIFRGHGHFRLTADTVIVASGDVLVEGRLLAKRILASTGFHLSLRELQGEKQSQIELRLDESESHLGTEGYRLLVNSRSVTVIASGKAGIFYGVQTLLQLFPPPIYADSRQSQVEWLAPCVDILDWPRFSWRGVMLDVSRHFMPVSFLYQFIDTLALHKINVLHLHLTDDQGWRLEIKKYPKLTEVGAFRKHTMVGVARINPANENFDPESQDFDGISHGGYYTQQEMRDIVTFAAERHITIVPEIEMPGHAQAIVAAYPALGCTDTPLEVSPFWGIHDVLLNVSEETIEFLQNVLREVMDIFPSEFIHIGGDEAVKKQWHQSKSCQARIAELKLRDEAQLQSYLIGRMESFFRANGRRLIGWDEILEEVLPQEAVVMSWRGEVGGVNAASRGHDVVRAPHQCTYLDYYQSTDRSREPTAFPSTVTLEQIYFYEPIPSELAQDKHRHILGAQGQLWTEYMPDSSQVEYMAFPRLCALAEVTWSNRERAGFDEFLDRLQIQLTRLSMLHVNFRRIK